MDPSEPLQPDNIGSETNPYLASAQQYESHGGSSLAAPESPLRIWPTFVAALLAFFAAVGFQIALGAGLAFRELARGVEPAELSQHLTEMLSHPGLFLVLAGSGQVAFALAAIIPARLSATPTKERLGIVPVRQSWTIYPLTVIGSLAPLGTIIGVLTLLADFLPEDPTAEMLFEQMTLAWSGPFVLFIALAPGFFEEMLFRGYMQRRLLQRWRPLTAITVTSVIFGLMHVMPGAVLLATVLGFWFGVIAWRTGSILPCIACHAFVNGGLNLWRVIVKFGEVPDSTQQIVVTASLVLGIACFLLACRQLFVSLSPEIVEASHGQEEKSSEVVAEDGQGS